MINKNNKKRDIKCGIALITKAQASRTLAGGSTYSSQCNTHTVLVYTHQPSSQRQVVVRGLEQPIVI